MIRERDLTSSRFLTAVGSAALTTAAFFYSCGLAFSLIKRVRFLPPTPAIAVGRVTIEHASKLHDYVVYAFCIAFIALTTLPLRRFLGWLQTKISGEPGISARLLFAAPFLLSPFLFLTTEKEAWAIALPPAVAAVALLARRRTILSDAVLSPFRALVAAEGASWILFRYLATGTRIAHIPTLFLELIFILFFLALTFAAVTISSNLISMLTGASRRDSFARVATALSPMLLLPVLGLTLIPPATIILSVLGCIALFALLVGRADVERTAPHVGRVVAIAFWPIFLFCLSYASTASLTSWVDLFHKGETLGPASDYLRGKLPYRDVFVLHGMLEDGLLDSWLMSWLGRDASIAFARITIIGSCTLPVLYLIVLTLTESVSLSLFGIALGLFTFLDNQRFVLHMLVVLFLLMALRGRRRALAAAKGGVISAFTLFYSFDIGLYAIVGTFAALAALFWIARRNAQERPTAMMLGYTIGLVIGAVPFVAYLASLGSLSAFFEVSFLQTPSIIDAVWSLPFPDLASTFHNDLTLRSISEFVLGERIRFVLNPIVIAIALVECIRRYRKGERSFTLAALILLTAAACVAQRSALGRADFQHQHFAAYLIAPIVVLLLRDCWRSIAAWKRESSEAIPFIALLVGALVAGALAALWVPDLLNSRIDSIISYRPRLSGIGYRDAQGDVVADRVAAVRDAIVRATPKNAPIFDFSNQPAFYFFTARRNPTRFYQIPVASTAEFQREVIHDLVRSRPPIVLRVSPERFDRFDEIPNEVRAPYLAAYVDAQYSFERSVRGIELWTRKPINVAEPRVGAVTIPSKEAAAPFDSRWIFPSVGSVRGLAASDWRTDLILHNPSNEPLTLRLRYESNRRNDDRGLTIDPHHTLVLKDVAGDFFGQPESQGPLSIRYPSSQRPIAAATSYDLSRPASASTESPLSTDRAASAVRSERLILNGLSTSDSRRLNVGVANIGQVPLRFRLIVRAGDGASVTQPMVAAVEEGRSFLLVDVAKQLGLAIDPTMTIEVTPTSGEAVAWGSMIEAASGSHSTLPATVTK